MEFWKTEQWLEYLLNSKIGTVYIDRSFYLGNKFVPLIQGSELYSPMFDDDKEILQQIREIALENNIKRIQVDTVIITQLTQRLRNGDIDPFLLPKTPHKSCPRFCQYFDICAAEDNGIDIGDMQRLMYVRQNPYDYGESTEEPISFEMG